MSQGFTEFANAQSRRRLAAASAARAFCDGPLMAIRQLTEIADAAETARTCAACAGDADAVVEAVQIAKAANAVRNIFENTETDPEAYRPLIDGLEAAVMFLLTGEVR
jgi:hypothetical protein